MRVSVPTAPPSAVIPNQNSKGPPLTDISNQARSFAAGLVQLVRSMAKVQRERPSGTANGPKVFVPICKFTLRSMSTEIGAAITATGNRTHARSQIICRRR